MGLFEDFQKSLGFVLDWLTENEIPFEIIDKSQIGKTPDVGIFHIEEEEEEKWFEYFGHIGWGYWGSQKIPSSEKTYYSQSENMKEEIADRMIDEFGARFLGYGEPVPPNVTDPYPVSWDEVDENNII